MGIPAGHNHLETEHLKLTAEHFPLPRSLLQPVLHSYTDLNVSAADDRGMASGELLDYIRNTADSDLPTLEAVLAQTEAIGDPALPNTQQVAILRWLAVALQDWDTRFGLEEPLATLLRPLRPIIAGLAVTDPNFLIPGAHPIHQIMDTIQDSAIGWQPRLGRAGQALERQLTQLVEKVSDWFDNHSIDLTAIGAELKLAGERDRTRSQRMAQRVVETEQGRVRTAEARRLAASMINTALARYPAPAGIGEFLKDPWYASAQLVLLKHGFESEQWQSMSDTTTALLDSLQSLETDTEERRQEIFQVVTKLPAELKRWLLNLHHDSEAVADAVALIEFAHLRVVRKQPLQLEKITPIPVTEAIPDNTNGDQGDSPADDLEVGQWYRIATGEDELRVNLALKLEHERQLLFTNQAGIKVLLQDYDEFARTLYAGRVTALESGASFSSCLAAAAGIRSTEELEEFTGAAAERARKEQDSRDRQEAQRLEQERQETQRLEQERQEAKRAEQERQEAKRAEQERQDAQRLEWERLEAERLEQERHVAERLTRERKEAERLERERQETERLKQERQEAERLKRERQERQERQEIERLERERQAIRRVEHEKREQHRLEREVREETQRLQLQGEQDADRLEREWEKARLAQAERDDAERQQARRETETPEIPDSDELEKAWDIARGEQEEQDAAERRKAMVQNPLQQEAGQESVAAQDAEEQAKIKAYLRQKQERQQRQARDPQAVHPEKDTVSKVGLNLPMGAWLGFHDGDTPLMAKLAVHDREQDQYFFVNREGIKMRQLSKRELLSLMDRGLVDILETNSNFRDEVTRIRGQLEE